MDDQNEPLPPLTSGAAGERVSVEAARTLGSAPNLVAGFLHSVKLYPDRPALEVAGTTFTYRQLGHAAATIAQSIKRHDPAGPPLTAVFASRSATAYSGVLGTLLAGNGYVPLNPSFPPDRTATMLVRSGCRSLIADGAAETQLVHILPRLEWPMVVILPDRVETNSYAAQWPQHCFLGARDLHSPNQEVLKPPQVDRDAIAYLLFTSGSTGVPKGVAVAHRNVVHFIRSCVARYQLSQADRFSQTFDLTFDLSVFDLFLAWEVGACVCCPSRKALLNPARFIRDSQLTIWFSVPSVGLMMRALGSLKPGAFPTLRWSLFCGEPLPAGLAGAWAEAAPQSTLENLYGPTEVTIACTAYQWDRRNSPAECDRNIVPIGEPLEGMAALVVDDNLREIPPGEEGELLMAGPQVSLGYWRDADKTAAAFVIPPGKRDIYYRTGDRVLRSLDGRLRFRGRLDHQIKVQGHRVELQEVEAILKQEAGADLAIAVGWPLTASGAGAIEAFIASRETDLELVRERLQARLPPYAVPRKIHLIDHWPLNHNGKIDRKQLVQLLEAGI